MKLHPLNLIIIVVYMLGTLGVGWWFSRKQRNIRDYFLSDNNAPWWALMGSIVATETSTVTFISVPAFAFAANASGAGGNFTFLQLVIGYMIGRLVIVALFIPLYFKGELFTVYQVLDQRFGGRVKRTAASLVLDHALDCGRHPAVSHGHRAGGAHRLGRPGFDSHHRRGDDCLHILSAAWRP